MCDETFSVNYTARVPQGVDHGWFMLWVIVLDYTYWVTGAALGGIFGTWVSFSTKGLDFVMTAMFVVIFMEQWMKEKRHAASIMGIVISAVFLVIFGSNNFVVPSMAFMLLMFMSLRSKLEIRKECQ